MLRTQLSIYTWAVIAFLTLLWVITSPGFTFLSKICRRKAASPILSKIWRFKVSSTKWAYVQYFEHLLTPWNGNVSQDRLHGAWTKIIQGLWLLGPTSIAISILLQILSIGLGLIRIHLKSRWRELKNWWKSTKMTNDFIFIVKFWLTVEMEEKWSWSPLPLRVKNLSSGKTWLKACSPMPKVMWVLDHSNLKSQQFFCLQECTLAKPQPPSSLKAS